MKLFPPRLKRRNYLFMTRHIIVSVLVCLVGGCSGSGVRHDPPLENTASQSQEPAPIPHGSCDFDAKAIRECSTELKSTLAIEDGWVMVTVPACAVIEEVFTPAFKRRNSPSNGLTSLLADGKTSLGTIHDTIVIRGEVVHQAVPSPPGTSTLPVTDVDVKTLLTCLVYPQHSKP